jgi:flagellar M-ring protein FliF
MNESFKKYLNKIKEYWTGRSKKQKAIIIGSGLLFVIAISVISIVTTRTTFVPLYKDLSLSEAGTIKDSLDERGVEYEIADGGTTIKVPDNQADSLLVDLASEGLPKSGNIDYSFFSQNASFGMTDNEFNVVKLDAMQTELAELIKGIDGVKDAKVMINLPEEGIFVSDEKEEASASIVLDTEPGYQFENNQIKALYHLVSKSVPNLPTDNIVITNQNFEYFDLENSENNSTDTYTAQNNIKKQVERDVQHQVQSMLGTLMGQDKVVVSVTADIDFTQENREENLVTPVDEENMEGIAISAQKITETYTGDGAAAGTPEGEDPADSLGTSYAQGDNGNGNYEKIEETVNNEVNKIRKEIIESPYKIRDLGIQVLVEPPVADDPNSLPQESVDDIEKMLGTIVRTTINKDEVNGELTEENIQDKIVVSVQEFNGKVQMGEKTKSVIPWWAYVVGGILLLVIALLAFLFIRARKKREKEAEEELLMDDSIPIHLADVNGDQEETESSLRRKQLEKMAREKPEDFAKLLRSWLAED